ncbi:MAG TPA: murein biosynthesis integral membrane protein MurJ [Lacunisphaera sp.]|nr:murein biosynthesis integral membrane protein MurJ [Lacunisphaera sp.]
MSKHLKNISVVATATVASRVLGLVRDQLGAAIFGSSLLNTAFLSAFRLPNLFRRLLGEGALTAAFQPTLQHELHEHGRDAAFALLNKVTSWLLLICGGLATVLMLVFSQSRRLPGHEDKWYLLADLTVILVPYLVLVCLAAPFSATLNVLHRFLEPALSPISLNLAMIVSLGGAGLHFASSPLGEIHWLCAGVLVGGTLQLLVPAVALAHYEGWRPRFDLGLSPRVREIALLMTPGLWGTAIYQVNAFVSSLLAYSINDSAGTLMFYANRLMELPIGVFAIAVSTVVYPLLSKHAIERNYAGLASDFKKGIRLILVINVPAAAGLALLSQPIVRVLFERHAFTAADTSAMSLLLALYVIGLPFFSVVSLTLRAFYALKNTKSPVRVATIDFLVNLGLSLLLMRWLDAAGLVIASTTAIIVQTWLLLSELRRLVPGLELARLGPSLGKIVTATLVMGLVVWAGTQWPGWLPLGPKARAWAQVLALVPLGCGAYATVLWLLKIEGREEFAALLGRVRDRLRSNDA